jgi:hypothetical protein
MRNFGLLMIIAGIAGFVYCTGQLGNYDPVPEGLSIGRSWDYPAGKLEVGRYAAAASAMIGFLMTMFPQGR